MNSVAFYKRKIPSKEKVFNKRFPLHPYFEEMIGDKKVVKIADLGAGMFSTSGSTYPNVAVDLYPSDLLADEYMRVLSEEDIKPIIPIERQDMTSLTYLDEYFDIVHCVNALDHCSKPLDALKEMYRVCKKGGWIYLRHGQSEGKRRKYTGLHQWNISKEGNNFAISDKESSDTVYGFNVSVEDKMIVCKMKKE